MESCNYTLLCLYSFAQCKRGFEVHPCHQESVPFRCWAQPVSTVWAFWLPSPRGWWLHLFPGLRSAEWSCYKLVCTDQYFHFSWINTWERNGQIIQYLFNVLTVSQSVVPFYISIRNVCVPAASSLLTFNTASLNNFFSVLWVHSAVSLRLEFSFS